MTQPVEYTGAMVALVPSQPDLERLALEGGEPLDQLHLTLLYLGEADTIDAETRTALIDAGRDMVQGWDSVEAEAFAPALFNPTGPEPCVVLICSGAELAEFYETAIADVTELIDLPPDMHLPWCAHITIAYGDVYEARDIGAGASGDGGANSSAVAASGRVPYQFSDSIDETPLRLDSAQPASQRDTCHSGGDPGATDRANGGRSPHLPDPSMRGAASPSSGGHGRSLTTSRVETISGDLLEASDSLLAAAGGQRVGGLPLLRAGSAGGLPGAETGGLVALMPSLIKRTGPVTFDILRFAFGGDVVDVPITSKVEAVPPTPAAVVESRPQAQPTTAAGSIREVWDGPLR